MVSHNYLTEMRGSSFENCARTKSSCTLLTFISGYPNLPCPTSPRTTPRVAQRAWVVNRLWLEMQRRVHRAQKHLSTCCLRNSMDLVAGEDSALFCFDYALSAGEGKIDRNFDDCVSAKCVVLESCPFNMT